MNTGVVLLCFKADETTRQLKAAKRFARGKQANVSHAYGLRQPPFVSMFLDFASLVGTGPPFSLPCSLQNHTQSPCRSKAAVLLTVSFYNIIGKF